MADVNISKYRASVVRSGSAPATPGFVVSEGQNPVEPAGSEQNHLPVTINATATGLAITTDQVLSGAGTVGQYIRGDGSLADFPASTGGGSSVSYYLNGSISQGTIGGVAYKELSKTPILGAGTQFTINADGYIASFLTDAGDPNLLEIPGGNWNFETYFSASSGGGSPTFYVELYKYDGSTFTLIASNSGSPELIAFGTNVNSYFSTLAVPTTALTLTDRLAIRYYVTHSGRTITLHTENNTLCQIITTFTTGLTALNGLTAQVQYFAVGTSGTDFNIASATQTHTFNLPTASASNRGALSSADWSTFNNKQNALTLTTSGSSGPATLVGATLNIPDYGSALSGYVPYTGASQAVNLGIHSLSGGTLFVNGTSPTSGSYLGFKQATSVTTGGGGYTSISTFGTSQMNFSFAQPSGFKEFKFDVSSITTGVPGGRVYTMPDADGTIALTSNIPSGIITGTGTTNYLPKFTGTSSIGNSIVQDAGIRVDIGGDIRLTPTSAVNIQAYTGSVYTNLFYNAASHNWQTSGGATKMFLNSNDNLLIGTTTDGGQRLQVTGTVALRASASGSSATQIPIFAADPSGTTRELVTRTPAQLLSDIGGQAALTNPVTGTGTTNYLPKFTGSTTVGNSQVFDNGTNVGIGTTSPDRKLGILVSPSATGDDGINITNGSTPFILTRTGASYTYRGVAANAGMIYSSSNIALLADGSNITFHNGNGQVASIQSNGNLLVGTTSDNGARLQVSGTSTFSGELNLQYNNAIQTIQGNTGFSLIRLYGGNGSSSNVVEFQIRNRVDGGDFSTIGNFSNHDLQIRTNNTARLTIAASTGAATFSSSVTAANFNAVSSNAFIIINDTSGNAAGQFQFQNNGIQKWNFATQATSNDLGLYNNGGTNSFNLYIKHSTGNVGIGTTSPYANLDLGASGANNIILRNTTNAYNLGYIGNSSGRIDIGFSNSNGSLVPLPYLSVNSSGNVGIGTTSPSYRLVVNSGTDGISAGVAGSTYGIRFDNGGTFSSGMSTIHGVDSTLVGSYQPIMLNGLDVRFGTSANERMRITSGGNVLIGTTTDNGARLQVSGAIYASDELYLDNGKYLRFRRSSGNLSIQTLGIPSGTDDVRLLTTGDFNILNGSLTNLMTVKNGGNVLIGTTTDNGARLQVSGTATFSSTIRSNDTYGFAVGSIASYRRIQYGSDNATSFTLLTDTNSYAGLYAGAATFSSSVTTGAPAGGTAQPWKLGTVATVSPTSPNRTIEVEVNGTTYYLHAKTTNN